MSDREHVINSLKKSLGKIKGVNLTDKALEDFVDSVLPISNPPKFKIGDRVTTDLRKETGTVVGHSFAEIGCADVKWDGYNYTDVYHTSRLRLIPEKKFKIGDRVSNANGNCIGTIIKNDPAGEWTDVKWDGDYNSYRHYYETSNLKLIPEMKFKAGDRVKLIIAPYFVGTVTAGMVPPDQQLTMVNWDNHSPNSIAYPRTIDLKLIPKMENIRIVYSGEDCIGYISEDATDEDIKKLMLSIVSDMFNKREENGEDRYSFERTPTFLIQKISKLI